MITRDDVAKKAGVSSATVSRVMNDNGYVKEEVREKVLKAAAELNYKPSMAAKNLRMNKSHTIAYVIPDVTNPYYTEIYKEISMAAAQKGYFTFLYEMNDIHINDKKNLITDNKLDGIILNASRPRYIIRHIEDNNIPAVSIGFEFEGAKTSSIIADLEKGAEQAVMYLYRMGHRKIALLARGNSEQNRVLSGYMNGLKKCGVSYDSDLVQYFSNSIYGYEKGYKSLKNLLRERKDFTAVMCSNDIVAIGGINAAIEEGLKVPEDLSFIGFDDSIVAAYSNPPMTTMKPVGKNQGLIAANMIFDLMEGKKVNLVKLDMELIVRKSVRKIMEQI